ncbi:SUMF1/EgtB/PvdO family nonheme iron enzyme [Nannocystis punicea]|uniref:SUMF1/EgtB/PvdO family nonheme iron enzyme n=1 Tax=Nannocystis punicea TaxID=2995304 RepID=A0ABY7HBI0_9BACT|nr:SUMF1/EgtB/PvdO family nonheme iron enzyme [Nannocystis poenicansa]WAS96394.1 SUMF1/EgtB/PvdO family nonheme iron enzyme [Nannocystis poenicansa]
MPDDEPVYRWLHLSDLHLGCRDEALWWQIVENFERSVDPWLAKVGAPDLLLLTGDLAWAGAEGEYGRLDRFLERLLAMLETKTGRRPLLVPIPGNHDVERPTGARLRPYRILDAYETDADEEDVKILRAEIWEKHDPEFVAGLFTHYTRWLERTVVPQLTGTSGVVLHRSFFPGDLTVTLNLPGRFPLAVVGLNSAWSHYKAGDFTGKLLLPAEQFLAALPAPAAGGSPLDVFRRVERALLLMHHPRKWLTTKSREIFDGQIHLGQRFTACLFGHMHEPDAVNVSQAGGAARSFYQAPSLFGLEHHGTTSERVFGYTFGQVAQGGEVRLWPLRSVRRGDGVWTFDRDGFFHWPGDDREGVLLRRADPEPRTLRSGPRPAPAPDLDLAAYCRTVLDETRYIRLDGIAAAAKALNHPIERLYTRLRTHAHGKDLRRDLVDLADLLPKHHRLLIEGQPGSGKTTFLKLAASVLARDFLDEPCPDGPSWRAVHLGREVARTLPIFIKLSRLATSTASKGAARLLDHLAEETTPRTGDTPELARARREALDRRLVGGEATLLLDGLDEVGDAALREQVFASLQDILRAWPKCQVVVTSRPIAVEPLRALGFAHASVTPFGPDEVRAYVLRWVRAYFETDQDSTRGAAEEVYAEKLIAALRSRQELRRLASAPVMLTCLCVVYSHGGGLPEGRAELYRDTIRWLVAAREQTRKDRGYGEVRVQEALSVLALAMMGGAKGLKRREIGLADAAKVVAPIVRGLRFEGGSSAERSDALRAWLRFECEYSGVIEEVGRGQLQFKHLTFQEYLAAAQLAAIERDGWWTIVKARLLDVQWRETVDLFPGCLLDRERGATSAADHLVKQVHKLWSRQPPLLRAARITAITGRFDPAFRSAKYQLPKELVDRDAQMLVQTEGIFLARGDLAVEERLRIEAAEAIGVAGDGRIAAERFVKNLLPEKGLSVRLGKYLVTVEEFARFVDDGGYRREELWVDDQGWWIHSHNEWEAPGEWEEQLRTPNRPVVSVSWFEAMAYCRWLSEEHPEWRVRLPTEAEWMAVASPDGRGYPWGDEPEPSDMRANFGGLVAPTPVGIYPAGNGKYGHSDLAGNVWEWSLDVDKDDEQLRGRGPPRVLCGGCFWSGAEGMVAAAGRVRYWSSGRYGDVGFRVAAEPASP